MARQNSSSEYRSVMRVHGVVQGVGFRPFVYRLAIELGLNGHVLNRGTFVEIELFSPLTKIELFTTRVRLEAPPLARIDKIEMVSTEPSSTGEALDGFKILESRSGTSSTADVPPDSATCDNCLIELFTADNRRFHYPFLNCVDCGPRFTVIKNLPYDRAETSLACFPMCLECTVEYENPSDRRFHAEPTACASCGPTIVFFADETMAVPKSSLGTLDFQNGSIADAIKQAVSAIRSGSIIAVKGLGGFQLVCDATNNDTVNRLRVRKCREAKPFAMMVAGVEATKEICVVSEEEQSLLLSPSRPIVLLQKRKTSNNIAPSVAPDCTTFGIMLPYTPLHHLLLKGADLPLVVTSGNMSEEPIAAGNREAMDRLGRVADGFLLNNRDIVTRFDDTVCSIVDKKVFLVRRARGFAPQAIQLPFKAKIPALAVGGHLKNTFCLINNDKAYVSQHIGDLNTLESISFFTETLERYIRLFNIEPQLIAADLHPEYGSSKLVDNWLNDPSRAPIKIESIKHVSSVQHHHAHIASCMTENRIMEKVIGVAFDGSGFGTDGNIWGGEFLICTPRSFSRVASFQEIRLPGAHAAIKEPWRMALSYLGSTEENVQSKSIIEKYCAQFGTRMVSNVMQLSHSLMSPKTTSCGRLFDAVASLLGLCDINLYEGHAAVLLQQAAENYKYSLSDTTGLEPYERALTRTDCIATDAGASPEKLVLQFDTSHLIKNVVEDLAVGTEKEKIASRFHDTIAVLILEVSRILRIEHNLHKVCFSGGVFQNHLLFTTAIHLLEADGFKVFFNRLVPTNDGGLSLGQASAALGHFDLLESL